MKGIAADITLDKDTYRVAENVRLHLAIEDFDAEGTIYSGDSSWDPCRAVGIEVRDGAGRVVPEEQRLQQTSFCMGHGFGPRAMAKGKMVPIDPVADGSRGRQANVEFRKYATAQAMATIHIVATTSEIQDKGMIAVAGGGAMRSRAGDARYFLGPRTRGVTSCCRGRVSAAYLGARGGDIGAADNDDCSGAFGYFGLSGVQDEGGVYGG